MFRDIGFRGHLPLGVKGGIEVSARCSTAHVKYVQANHIHRASDIWRPCPG